MNNFNDYNWHDSSIDKIEIFENSVILNINNAVLNSQIKISCLKTAGLTNLCMWEDTIISTANLNIVSDFSGDFLQSILMAHPQYDNDVWIPIKKGLLDLAIKMTNDITFHIYCYDVAVSSIKENNTGDGSTSRVRQGIVEKYLR